MSQPSKIEIFRWADAKELLESGVMSVAPMTDEQGAGMMKLVHAGYTEGDEVKILTTIPGFTLAHAWFKRDYPLMLHTHDSDCLYYVVAGNVRMGTETLGAGDCLFVPAGAAYTYTPGVDGAEVLEFRHATQFDFQNLAKGAAFYEKGAATVAANLDAWRNAERPSVSRGAAAAGEVVERMLDALAKRDLDAARACFTPDAVVWHGFDQIEMNLDDVRATWQQLLDNFPVLSFVDVQRSAIPGGVVERYRMIAKTQDGVTLEWPVSVFVTLRDGLISRLDEYIDRAGAKVVSQPADGISA